MHIVKFAREGITVEVPHGTTLRKAAARCNIRLYSHVFRFLNCQGFGRCGECRVIVMEGTDSLSQASEHERSFKRPSSSRDRGTFGIYEEDGERLPCQAYVLGNVTVWTRPRDGGPPAI